MDNYKKMTVSGQRHFVSIIIDLLLASPEFCQELIVLIRKYEAKTENMPDLRKRKDVVQQGEMSKLLTKRADVQPKEDFTKTAEYQAIRETKGVLPFERRIHINTSDVRGWASGVFRYVFGNPSSSGETGK